MTIDGPPPARLVDLGIDWLRQYAGESTLYEAKVAPWPADRLAEVDGYLSSTVVALVWINPDPDSAGPTAWASVMDRFARVEAEFAGRLLVGPADLERLDAEAPGSLTWAVVGLRNMAGLLESSDAADRFRILHRRGLRAIRPAADSLERLGAAIDEPGGPGLLIDLTGQSDRAASEFLDRIGTHGRDEGPIVPIATLAPSTSGHPEGLGAAVLGRLRDLGGLIGLRLRAVEPLGPDALAATIDTIASVPFRDRPGFEGIGLATDFLGEGRAIAGLDRAEAVLDWLASRYDRERASAIAAGNARRAIARVLGAGSVVGPGPGG